MSLLVGGPRKKEEVLEFLIDVGIPYLGEFSKSLVREYSYSGFYLRWADDSMHGLSGGDCRTGQKVLKYGGEIPAEFWGYLNRRGE